MPLARVPILANYMEVAMEAWGSAGLTISSLPHHVSNVHIRNALATLAAREHASQSLLKQARVGMIKFSSCNGVMWYAQSPY